MKRQITIAVLIMLVLSLSAVAQAEVFQLRNGILFGDTMEDILAKETSLERESDDSNWFKGTIAGYSGSECGFYFNDDGKLISMDYSFSGNTCSDRDTTRDVYRTIYQSLCRKYGNAIGNTGGTVELITGPAIERMAIYVYLLGETSGYSADYIDYDEWIVDTDEGHVKIDLISFYWRDDSYNYYYNVDASYHLYTDADLENAKKEKQGQRDAVDNDM